MTKKEQIAKIRAAMTYCTKTIAALQDSDNPQSALVVERCKAKLEAYDAVIGMMYGDNSYINIEAN